MISYNARKLRISRQADFPTYDRYSPIVSEFDFQLLSSIVSEKVGYRLSDILEHELDIAHKSDVLLHLFSFCTSYGSSSGSDEDEDTATSSAASKRYAINSAFESRGLFVELDIPHYSGLSPNNTRSVNDLPPRDLPGANVV